MSINFTTLFPLIFATLVFFEFFIFLILISRAFSLGNLKTKRKQLLKPYMSLNSSAIRNSPIQIAVATNLFEEYSKKLVKNQYGSKLQALLLNSGETKDEGFVNLGKRKFGYSFAVFLIAFFFLILKSPSILPLILGFFALGYFLPNLGQLRNRIIGRGYKSKLENLSSSPEEWQVNQKLSLIRRKLTFAFISMLISYLYLVLKTQSFNVLPFVVLLVLFGFFLPDILLQNEVLKRKELIVRGLPDAIDMLLMCVNAGLAFPAALSKVAETQSGPVAEEFFRVTKEVQLGQSRADALLAMANRTNEPRVRKFVSAMVQVDKFGIPVSSVLTEQALEMRLARRESAREQGQKVPLKILAPIMLCLLPCVIVIILGPAVLGIIQVFAG